MIVLLLALSIALAQNTHPTELVAAAIANHLDAITTPCPNAASASMVVHAFRRSEIVYGLLVMFSDGNVLRDRAPARVSVSEGDDGV